MRATSTIVLILLLAAPASARSYQVTGQIPDRYGDEWTEKSVADFEGGTFMHAAVESTGADGHLRIVRPFRRITTESILRPGQRPGFNGGGGYDSLGRYVAAWHEEGVVYAQVYDSDDVALSDTILVWQYDCDLTSRPDGALFDDGRFAVVWSVPSCNPRWSDYRTWMRSYDAQGRPMGEAAVIGEYPDVQGDTFPAIAANEITGSYWAAHSVGPSSGPRTIMMQRFGPTGNPLSEMAPLLNEGSEPRMEVGSIAFSSSGKAVIAWGGSSSVEMAWFDQAGVQLSPAVRVDDDPDFKIFREPFVMADEDGNALVAWVPYGSTSSGGIRAQFFEADGRRLGGNFRVNDPCDC